MTPVYGDLMVAKSTMTWAFSSGGLGDRHVGVGRRPDLRGVRRRHHGVRPWPASRCASFSAATAASRSSSFSSTRRSSMLFGGEEVLHAAGTASGGRRPWRGCFRWRPRRGVTSALAASTSALALATAVHLRRGPAPAPAPRSTCFSRSGTSTWASHLALVHVVADVHVLRPQVARRPGVQVGGLERLDRAGLRGGPRHRALEGCVTSTRTSSDGRFSRLSAARAADDVCTRRQVIGGARGQHDRQQRPRSATTSRSTLSSWPSRLTSLTKTKVSFRGRLLKRDAHPAGVPAHRARLVRTAWACPILGGRRCSRRSWIATRAGQSGGRQFADHVSAEPAPPARNGRCSTMTWEQRRHRAARTTAVVTSHPAAMSQSTARPRRANASSANRSRDRASASERATVSRTGVTRKARQMPAAASRKPSPGRACLFSTRTRETGRQAGGQIRADAWGLGAAGIRAFP